MDPLAQDQKTNKGIIMSVVALFVVAGAVFATFKYLNQTSSGPNTDALPTAPVQNTETSAILNPKYKDGSYSADGYYQSPGGTDFIKVTLVLKNDVVSDASITVPASTKPESKYFQDIVASDFKQYVVGKNLDQVNLTKISGSSLTPIGFNDAVAKIKAQAKS